MRILPINTVSFKSRQSGIGNRYNRCLGSLKQDGDSTNINASGNKSTNTGVYSLHELQFIPDMASLCLPKLPKNDSIKFPNKEECKKLTYPEIVSKCESLGAKLYEEYQEGLKEANPEYPIFEDAKEFIARYSEETSCGNMQDIPIDAAKNFGDHENIIGKGTRSIAKVTADCARTMLSIKAGEYNGITEYLNPEYAKKIEDKSRTLMNRMCSDSLLKILGDEEKKRNVFCVGYYGKSQSIEIDDIVGDNKFEAQIDEQSKELSQELKMPSDSIKEAIKSWIYEESLKEYTANKTALEVIRMANDDNRYIKEINKKSINKVIYQYINMSMSSDD